MRPLVRAAHRSDERSPGLSTGGSFSVQLRQTLRISRGVQRDPTRRRGCGGGRGVRVGHPGAHRGPDADPCLPGGPSQRRSLAPGDRVPAHGPTWPWSVRCATAKPSPNFALTGETALIPRDGSLPVCLRCGGPWHPGPRASIRCLRHECRIGFNRGGSATGCSPGPADRDDRPSLGRSGPLVGPRSDNVTSITRGGVARRSTARASRPVGRSTSRCACGRWWRGVGACPLRLIEVTAPLAASWACTGVPLKGFGAMTSCTGPATGSVPANEAAAASRLPGGA